MSSVNTNMGAVVSAANMAKFGRELDTSIERLSSGLRINSAKDDAAGMAIVSKMEAQVRGVNQAIRNANDSQKLIDTSEGAHVETLNILQRLRELAVQASNDTNQALDRSFLNSEATQLIAEIDRIANQTTWNGEKILDGTFQSKQFQLGANENEKVTYSIDSAKSSNIGNYKTTTGVARQTVDAAPASGAGDANAVAADAAFVVTGYLGSNTLTIAQNSSAATVAGQINGVTSETGVTASAVTKASITLQGAASIKFNLSNGTSSSAISVNISDNNDIRGLKNAINAVAGTTGITAEMSSNSKIILTHSTGEDIYINSYDSSVEASTMTVMALDATGTTDLGTDASGTAAVLLDDVDASADDAVSATRITGQLDANSHEAFTVAVSNSDATGFFSSANNSGGDNFVSSISLGTAANAEAAITVIDGAINKINQSRADLGAISNRLDSTISNLTNVATNVEGSMSNIRDADFSIETSKLTRAQILTQAATSMLAQANTSKQSILALLQG
ncbi:flagellin [Alphaproteobacteria bacterium]|nr:flagellin [Alphaproteobacteria bacterium]